jgi:DNA invertase Pin-like site-specific DNA recombinase
MRVAIYARVSTDDKGQDPGNQLRELWDWVVNSDHIISREYVDYVSGRKGAERRKINTESPRSIEKPVINGAYGLVMPPYQRSH